jgi:hypothetical protein
MTKEGKTAQHLADMISEEMNVGPIFIVVHKDKALGWHVTVVAAPNAVVQLQHAAEKIAEELRHTYFLIETGSNRWPSLLKSPMRAVTFAT